MTDRRWLAGFAALCVGQFLAHQTALSFSALIPILKDEWRLSASQTGLILGVFQLGRPQPMSRSDFCSIGCAASLSW